MWTGMPEQLKMTRLRASTGALDGACRRRGAALDGPGHSRRLMGRRVAKRDPIGTLVGGPPECLSPRLREGIAALRAVPVVRRPRGRMQGDERAEGRAASLPCNGARLDQRRCARDPSRPLLQAEPKPLVHVPARRRAHRRQVVRSTPEAATRQQLPSLLRNCPCQAECARALFNRRR